jgi:hypothetical protein
MHLILGRLERFVCSVIASATRVMLIELFIGWSTLGRG